MKQIEELSLSMKHFHSLLDSLLGKAHSNRVKVSCKGFSMSPFIKDSDTVIIKPVKNFSKLKIGDIVVVPLSKKKKIIIHRIIEFKGHSLLLKGDNLFGSDGWFKKRDVMGIVETIVKKNNFKYKCNPFINYVVAIGSRTKILNHALACFRQLKQKNYV